MRCNAPTSESALQTFLIEFLGWGCGIPFCCCLLCQELYTIKTLGLRFPPAPVQQPTIIVVQGGGQVPQQQFMYAQQPGMPPQQVTYPQQYPTPQAYPPLPQQHQHHYPQAHPASLAYPRPQGHPQAQVLGYDLAGKQIQAEC